MIVTAGILAIIVLAIVLSVARRALAARSRAGSH